MTGDVFFGIKEQAKPKGKKGFWNFIWVIVLWANKPVLIISIEITLLNVKKKKHVQNIQLFWKMQFFMIASDQQRPYFELVIRPSGGHDF